MGRARTRDKHLPRRVYLKHGAYYLVRDNKWIRLGDDYPSMMRALADLNTSPVLATMGDVFDRYELEVIPTKATKTQRDQIRQLGTLRSVFGSMRPDAITTQQVFAYVDIRSRKARTSALREKALLSHVFTLARMWGACSVNPCQGVRMKHPKPRDRYVTDAEFDAVKDLAPRYVRQAMDLALLTGLRQSDILALKVSDVADEGLTCRTAKTGKMLVFEWTPALRAVVEDCRNREVASIYLLSNTRSRPMTVEGFRSTWQRVMARFVSAGGTRFTFHDLRAKSASDSASEQEASQRLGHSSTAMTRRTYMRAPVKSRPLR